MVYKKFPVLVLEMELLDTSVEPMVIEKRIIETEQLRLRKPETIRKKCLESLTDEEKKKYKLVTASIATTVYYEYSMDEEKFRKTSDNVERVSKSFYKNKERKK